jgi:uncharacterized membrane protein
MKKYIFLIINMIIISILIYYFYIKKNLENKYYIIRIKHKEQKL